MDQCAELKNDGKGGIYASVCSNLAAMTYAGAKLTGFNYFHELIANGPRECTFQGPLLAEVTYPDVLVAKAWSDGENLDLVLYDGEGAVSSIIKLERLRPNQKYQLGDQNFKADAAGRSAIQVQVNGRTALCLKPVH